MMMGGTTTLVDMYPYEEAVAEAAQDAGIRAVVCPCPMDFRMEHFENDWRTVKKRFSDSRLVTMMMGPHAIYTLSDNNLQRSISLSGELGVGSHVHLAETKTEQDNCMVLHGMSPTEYLEKEGLFSTKTLAAHCVVMSDHDIEILAKYKVSVAHNPQSNMKLSSGIAPIKKMLDAGINVSLGTDGASSNNDLDMWEEMRTASLLQKVATMDPCSIPAYTALQMATVTWESSLVDHCMADIGFEKEHDVVLIAIAREGEHIKDIPRETMIRPGDTLLFEGSRMDTESLYNDLLFFDTVALPQQGKKTYMSMVIMSCMVLLSALRIMPLLYSALLAAGAMLITHCCSAEQMRRAINWKIVMVFAGSVCIGKAIETTGLANVLGNSIADTFGFSPLLTLFMFCLIATILTEFISNATAAAVLIPIAIETAEILGANTLTFVVALMISISSAFATPIGNETNTMVYGPGGYKFSDFMKLGLLMNIVILITNIVATCLVYPIEK